MIQARYGEQETKRSRGALKIPQISLPESESQTLLSHPFSMAYPAMSERQATSAKLVKIALRGRLPFNRATPRRRPSRSNRL